MEKPSYNILLIDDDQFLLDMYALKFTNRGHNMTVAHDPTEALTLLQNGMTPDIILCDMVMPKMTGVEFLQEFRKAKLVPSAFLIMLTNQGQSSDIEACEEYGISGYIIKATSIPSEVVTEVERIARDAAKEGFKPTYRL
jgi:CheY-like chemotaxis protein